MESIHIVLLDNVKQCAVNAIIKPGWIKKCCGLLAGWYRVKYGLISQQSYRAMKMRLSIKTKWSTHNLFSVFTLFSFPKNSNNEVRLRKTLQNKTGIVTEFIEQIRKSPGLVGWKVCLGGSIFIIRWNLLSFGWWQWNKEFNWFTSMSLHLIDSHIKRIKNWFPEKHDWTLQLEWLDIDDIRW